MAVKLRTAAVTALVATGYCLAFFSPAIIQNAMAQNAGLASMKLDGKQPISIESDRLEVLEAESKAIFNGAVNVVQGTTSLQAGNLIVFYAKKGNGAATTGSVATGSAAIERLELSGKVVITSEKQTATGDAGSFDMASNIFELTGQRVVLSEGGNVAVGCKLTVQMSTGQANLDSCPKGGRVQIMINPQSTQGN